MRKVIPFCLAALLLLNVMGYYGLFMGLTYHHTRHITRQFDTEQYLESKTVTIKVPLAIPYRMDTDYERINGEIEHNGEFYRLVKQKYTQDTLYIICYKDTESKHLKQALADYVKTFTDHPRQSSSANTISIFCKDYLTCEFHFGKAASGWCLPFCFGGADAATPTPSIASFSPPPEA